MSSIIGILLRWNRFKYLLQANTNRLTSYPIVCLHPKKRLQLMKIFPILLNVFITL